MTTGLIDKFRYIVDNELSNALMPVRTKHGIRVGNVDIISEGSLKHIKIKNKIKFSGIFLNVTAITLANMLVNKHKLHKMKEIYEADQQYGRFFIDSQILRYNYNQAVKDRDDLKTNILWSRYIDRCDRVNVTKRQVEKLIKS